MTGGARGRAGFTVVELMVAAVVAGITLVFVAIFFVQQTDITRRTQARHEVETTAKSVAELVAQDLQIAGSRVVFNTGVTNNVTMPCSTLAAVKCVSSPSGGAGSLDDLRLYYATSLRPTTPCRRIDYRVDNGSLQRSELAATGVNCASLTTATPAFTTGALADNITEFDLAFLCADETTTTDPAACYAAGSFPRQATVRVTTHSTASADITASVELSTSMPNLRY